MSGCSSRSAVVITARCLPMRVRVLCCALGWLVLLPPVARAESVPFVAGFDRFFRDAAAADLAVGGRLLLTELNCTACHRTSERALEPKQGPHLDGAGEQLRPGWIK